MRKYGYLATLILSVIRGLVSQQQFLSSPSAVVVSPGSNTTLSCLVENMGGECRWQKDGKPVGIYPGKYTLAKPDTEGDCSLTIFSVDLKLDDGEWECQVTSTSFQSQDALASSRAKLTVQVPPSTITLHTASQGTVEDHMMLSLAEDQLETITCVTSHSNPAPTISWQMGDQLLPSTKQTTTGERTAAILIHSFARSSSGQELQCVVSHAAYPSGERVVTAILDMLYKPTVSIARVDTPVLEDGVGSVTLTCNSQANPPARASWHKMGDKEGKKYPEELQMNPVRREQAGVYICQAENSVGRSEPEETEVVVLYAPMMVVTQPKDKVEVMAHNRTVLKCQAEGYPAPKYQWIQTLSASTERTRSYTANLVVEDVGYGDQGEYRCVAINRIGGERREVESEPVKIEVTGAPQVVKQVGEVVGIHGSDVRLEAEFCSDPVPSESTWEWGGVVLPTGTEVDGRYKAELVPHPHMEDCYISRLTVRRVGQEDSKEYMLNVQNKHGNDMVPVVLNIKAPVPLLSAIAGASLLLLLLLLVLSTCLLLRNKHKLCWQDKMGEKEGSLGENT